MTIEISLLDPSPSRTPPPALLEGLPAFIQARLIEHIPCDTARGRHILRVTLKVAGSVLGAAGQAAFIKLNLDFAGDCKPCRVLLPIADCTSFAVLTAWSVINLVDERLPILYPELTPVLRDRDSPCNNVIIFVAATIAGEIIFIPFTGQAYDFNHPGLPFAILVATTLPAFGILSISRTIREFQNRRSLSDLERDLTALRTLCIATIQETKAHMRKHGIPSALLHADNPQVYLEAALSPPEAPAPPPIPAANIATQALAHTLLAFNLGYLGYWAFDGSEDIWDEVGFATTMTVLSVAGNAWLTRSTILGSARALIYDLCLGRYEPTLSDRLAPKTALVAKLAGFLLCVFTFGPIVEASRDAFDDTSKSFSLTMQIGTCLSTIFLLATPMLETIDGIIEEHQFRRGAPEARELIQTSRDLDKLCQVLQTTKLRAFCQLFLTISPDTQQRFFDRLSLTADRLRTYLATFTD